MDKKTFRGLIQSISQSARRLLPLHFQRADPDFDEDLSRNRKEWDAESNRETTPADDEVIDLCCIWAVEFYTPSHMDALLTNVRKIGWNEEGLRRFHDILDWANRSREHPKGGGWQNLGTIRSSGTNDITMAQVHPDALPPPHVTDISGRLFSVTSSLACVIMMFRLQDDFSSGFDTALRTNRRTYYSKVSSRSRAIHDPEDQKIDSIRHIREEMRGTISKWFSTNLPGLFSSGLLEGERPTCEFLTLRNAEPFPSTAHPAPNFLRTLGLYSSIDAWACAALPGLKFSPSHQDRSVPPYHSIFSIKEDDLDDDRLKAAMNWAGRQARIVYLENFAIDGPFWLWALSLMLEGYGKRLGTIRESTMLRLDAGRNSVKILNDLAQYVSDSVDINVVTSDLQNLTQPSSFVFFRYPSFVPVAAEHYPDDAKLEDYLCSSNSERATWIHKMDQALRDHGTQYGSLLSARDNVRIQANISRLTWVLVGLTVILGFLTLRQAFPLSKLLEWMQNAWAILSVLEIP